MRHLLLAAIVACTPDPGPASAAPAAGTGGGGTGTGVGGSGSPADDSGDAPVGPGSWADPITQLADLDVVLSGVELTDAARLGDMLIMAGQQQGQDGGLWRYDLSDPDAPRLTGKSSIWHAQRVCISSPERAWATERNGRLVPYDISGDTPQPSGGFNGGGWDYGLDCTEERLAWGEGARGGVVATLDGAAVRDPVRLGGEVIDLMLDGDRVWVVASDGLEAVDVSTGTPVVEGSVALPGYCGDVAWVGGLLAVACGAGGVSLVDPGDGSPTLLGTWRGHASARRVSAAGDGHVLVAAWAELLLLDVQDPAAPRLVGSEPANSSVMSVVGDGAGRAFVADWSAPFVVALAPSPAPEVRPSSRYAQPGAIVRLFNDGDEVLWLGPPTAGLVDRVQVPAGGEARWQLPDDMQGGASIETDDPDEPSVELVPAGLDGPVLGEAAPQFIERDLDGTVWDSSALAGQVVFLGLLQEGCPTCSSEVPAVEATLREALGEDEGAWRAGFVRLWAFDGQESRARTWADEYGIADPVLADGDRSLRQEYFVPNGSGAFASNPRHYVIDREGRLVFLSTTVAPVDLVSAIEDALATDGDE
jgi:peroxiredoxin